MANIFKGFSTIDKDHKNNTVYDIELVKRDILNHFHTRKGERVMMPDFGSIVCDMLFEPLTESNKNLIIEDSTDIINSDSRVALENTKVVEYEHGIRIEFDVYYIPLKTFGTFSTDFDRRLLERT